VLGLLLLLLTIGPLAAQASTPGILITEVMAANTRTALDDQGGYSDWIELHNPTDMPIPLIGYTLTDDPDTPAKWSLPAAALASEAFLLVWASGLDRVAPDGWHASFRLSRTGAYQGYGVEPDLMSAAKPLAGGLPIGAIMMKQKVADTIHAGDHASTFAGNPFTTHVASTVVDRVSNPEFLADVKEKGEYLMELLAELNSPHILEIRGRGLIVGIEMDIEAGPLMEKGYEAGLLLLSAGDKILRFVPPLTISKEELAQAVSKLGGILQEM